MDQILISLRCFFFRFGDTTLQESINIENFYQLHKYHETFASYAPDYGKIYQVTKNHLYRFVYTILEFCRLASVGILGKGREPEVGKLGWHGNFDTGFEILIQNSVCGFFELF